MKRLLTLIFILFFVLAGTALALDKKGFLVSEGDGTPSNTPVYKVIYPNGSTAIANSVLTLTLEASVAGTNIFYVAKHGNDSNSGLTRNLAKLTFQAAITAAAAGDVVICLDGGTYVENLTGKSGVDIFAPNAILTGAHTMTTTNDWNFEKLIVLTDTIGVTMNTSGEEAHLQIDHMDIDASSGSLTAGILSLDGALFVDVEHLTVGANAYGVGSTTTDAVYIDFGLIELAEGATAFGIAASGDLHAFGASVEDGANSGILIYSADVASNVHMIITQVDLTILSDIGATPDVSLVVADLAGTLTESGGGTILLGGEFRTASTTISGISELADTGETSTGTDTSRVVTPDGLAGSVFGEKSFCIVPTESDTDTAIADGKVAFTVPASMNGMNLVDVIASVHTQGVTNALDVQLRRRRAGSEVDMLSTKVTIGAEYFASDESINASNDDINTGDQIYVDVDAIHTGTAAKGLSVCATFRLP